MLTLAGPATASVTAHGHIHLAWSAPATNEQLTFVIYRQDPGAPGPRVIALTNRPHFTDDSAPNIPGATLLYFLQSRIGEHHGPLSNPTAIDLPVNTPATLPFQITPARRAA